MKPIFSLALTSLLASTAAHAHDIPGGGHHVHTAAGYTLDHVVAEDVVATVPKIYGAGTATAVRVTEMKEVLPMVQMPQATQTVAQPAKAQMIKLTGTGEISDAERAKINAYLQQRAIEKQEMGGQKVFRTGPGISGAQYMNYENTRRYDVDGEHHVDNRRAENAHLNVQALQAKGAQVVVVNKYNERGYNDVDGADLSLMVVRMRADWDQAGRALDTKVAAVKKRLANERIQFIDLDITNERRKERSAQMAKILKFDWFDNYSNQPDALLLVNPRSGGIKKVLNSRVHHQELEESILEAAGLLQAYRNRQGAAYYNDRARHGQVDWRINYRDDHAADDAWIQDQYAN